MNQKCTVSLRQTNKKSRMNLQCTCPVLPFLSLRFQLFHGLGFLIQFFISLWPSLFIMWHNLRRKHKPLQYQVLIHAWKHTFMGPGIQCEGYASRDSVRQLTKNRSTLNNLKVIQFFLSTAVLPFNKWSFSSQKLIPQKSCWPLTCY